MKTIIEPSTWNPRFDLSPVNKGFVVDEVAPIQVFNSVFLSSTNASHTLIYLPWML